jgi:hypothetical protein
MTSIGAVMGANLHPDCNQSAAFGLARHIVCRSTCHTVRTGHPTARNACTSARGALPYRVVITRTPPRASLASMFAGSRANLTTVKLTPDRRDAPRAAQAFA